MINVDKKNFFREKDYKKFMDMFDNLINDYLEEYAFLGLDTTSWDKVVGEALENIKWDSDINILVKKIKEGLTKILKEYIFKSINNNNPVLINNMLVLIKKKEKDSLKVWELFIKMLKKHEIVLDDDYIDVLKNSSNCFKSLLKNLELDEVASEELLEIIGSTDLLLELKPSNLSLLKTKLLYDYFKTVNQGFCYEYLKLFKKSLEVKKLRLLIKYYQKLDEIYEYMLKLELKISKNSFDFYLSSLSLKKLENILLNFGCDNYILCALYNELLSYQKNCDIYKKKTIYDFFRALVGQSEEERRELVDELVIQLSPTKQERLWHYINNNYIKERVEARKDLELLQKQYYERCSKKGYTKKKYKTKTLYDRFLDIPGKSFDEKKIIVDNYFKELTEYEQNLVLNYLKGNINSASKEGKKAIRIISNIRAKYERAHLNLCMIKPLINRIKTVSDEDLKLKALVINNLVDILEKDHMNALILYLEGKLKHKKRRKSIS